MGPDHPNVPGYDPMIQSQIGYMEVTGQEDGPPTLMGVPLVDLKAGHEGYANVMLALAEPAEQAAEQPAEQAVEQPAEQPAVPLPADDDEVDLFVAQHAPPAAAGLSFEEARLLEWEELQRALGKTVIKA